MKLISGNFIGAEVAEILAKEFSKLINLTSLNLNIG